MRSTNVLRLLAIASVAACGNASADGLYGVTGQDGSPRQAGAASSGSSDAGTGGSEEVAPPVSSSTAAAGQTGTPCDHDEKDDQGKGKDKGGC